MPETQVLIRGTELRTFKRCRMKWHWNYRKRLQRKRKKGALTFGTIWHIAMERYYPPGRKRGIHPAHTFEKVYVDNIQEFDQWDEEGNKIDALELGIAMAKGYVERWGADDSIEIVHPEESFEIDIYDKHGRYLCTFVGKFDGLAFSHKTGRYFIFEHKTIKGLKEVKLISDYGEQGLGYFFAANIWLRHLGILREEQFVDGIMFNFARKGLADDRPENERGLKLNKPSKDALLDRCGELGLITPKRTVEMMTEALRAHGDNPALLGVPSKNQPAPLFTRQEIPLGEREVLAWENRMRRTATDIKHTDARRLAIYKNPTRDCDWDCDYLAACEVHEMGGDWQGVLDAEYKSWSPYSDHELDQELKA